MDSLDELKQLANTAANKKGRMNADECQKTAKILESLWVDPDAPSAEVMSCMDRLPSEPIADAVGLSWEFLDSNRRSTFLRWLPGPSSERNVRRRLLVSAALLDSDAATSFELLRDCLSPDERPFTKELRTLVASTFFDRRSPSFEGFVSVGKPSDNLLRVLDLLLQTAIEKKVTLGTRYQLVCTVLRVIAQSRLYQHPTAISVLGEIEGDIRDWHVEFLARLEGFLRELDAVLFERLLRPQVKHTESVIETSEGRSEQVLQTHAEPLPSKETQDLPEAFEKERVFELLDSNIAGARAQIAILESIRGAFVQLTSEQNLVKSGLIQAQQQIRALEDALSSSDERKLAYEGQLAEKVSRISGLEEQVKSLRHDFDIERQELIERMHLNTRGVLEEFKNSLGVTLRRLLEDMPSPDGDFNADLARFVLARVQQVVESLEDRGVKIRAM